MNAAASSCAVAENPWLARPVRIQTITPEYYGVTTYHLRFVDGDIPANYSYQPGQFNMLYLPGVGEIAISVSGSGKGTLHHTVREVGNTTRALSRLGRRGSLGLRGPYGTWWPIDECQGADVIVVAGGIGLAPLRSAIEAVLKGRKTYGAATLLYGSRTPDTLLYSREYSKWSRGRFQVQTTVDRAAQDWQGNVGVAPLLLARLRPLNPANTVLWACGPEIMMRYTVHHALARGIAKERIWISMERNMQCAVGLCGHCQFGPAFVCKDGPVFRYDAIEPYLDVEGL